MDTVVFSIVRNVGSRIASSLVDPKVSGARLIDKRVALGPKIRWTWIKRDLVERDARKLVRELLLRAGNADPEIRAIDPEEGRQLIDELVAALMAFDSISIDLVEASNLGPDRLACTLESAGRSQVRRLSPASQILFDRTLRMSCVHIINHFTESPEFMSRTAVEISQDIGYIKDLLDGGHQITTWTNSDISKGMDAEQPLDHILPIERGERIDIATLRQGRLPGLQDSFHRLVSTFDDWIGSGPQRKLGPERVRIFWLIGDPVQHRSKGLLSCLARAGTQGRVIHDVGRDLRLASKAVDRATFNSALRLPPVVGVDLTLEQSQNNWTNLSNVLSRARTQRFSSDNSASRLIDPYPRLIVAGTEGQSRQAYDALEGMAEITPVDIRGVRWARLDAARENRMTSRTLGKEHTFNQGLPITARELFGRQEELQSLLDAWGSTSTKIQGVVAYGGTGKSALVNSWLRRMRDSDYMGARRVFAWSFYSQGTKENLVSADPFINSALAWLGESEFPRSLPEKGRLLAGLIKEHHFLLVLDGIEPLQHPITAPPDVAGRFTDESMRTLLIELAKPDWRGLCVITTRVPLTDLARFKEPSGDRPGTYSGLSLENLDDQAAVALLKKLAQVGDDNVEDADLRPSPSFRQLQEVVQSVDGHALAVTLLGNYVRDVHNGDISGRFDLEELAHSPREGGHARRIMESYARWLRDSDRIAELSVLNIVGLFDRPAAPEAMASLLGTTDRDPFRSGLDSVGGEVWNRSIDALRGMGLLNNEIPEWPGFLDAHPLVREHFRDILRKQDHDGWRQGNKILYDYCRNSVPISQPETRAEMNTLYSAVTHGCEADLYQEVFDMVLFRRVWRDRRTNYSTRVLGMTGSDLVALSNYFPHRRWDTLRHHDLTLPARILLMTNAGVRLRQLGRLLEARQSFGAVVTEIDSSIAETEQLQDASYAMAQSCELLVIAGKLKHSNGRSESAKSSGEKAIAYSDRGRDPYFRMHARSSLAEVNFMLGDLCEAERLFDEARAIDRQEQPNPPFLYSQSLFRYGYYLIESGRAEEILVQAESPDWGTNSGDTSLLSRAIRHLVLGAAHRSLLERGESRMPPYRLEELLNEALNEFRSSGYADYTVRGLLEKAHFSWLRGESQDLEICIDALDEAGFEAARGEMDLLKADTSLQRASCYLKFWDKMTNPERRRVADDLRQSLGRASALVDQIGYERRRAMVESLFLLVKTYGLDPIVDDNLWADDS